MKVFMAKFLLIMYLFSSTPLREFVKVPVLVSHYLYHMEVMPEMTMQRFFSMHYLEGTVHDEDFHQDQQLPFKTVDFNTLPVFVLQSCKMFDTKLFSLENQKDSSNPSNYNFFLSEATRRGIFHPPQFS
jgi:hypothetical protein